MTENQRIWTEARDRLRAVVSYHNFPEELADILAKQLGSPKAIDRMTSYFYQVHPRSMEMIVDEMLAIRSEIDAWKQKKASEESQAVYNTMLFNGYDFEDDGN
ncbi:MAG: hypothetical protein IJM63_05675 [Solobacterium sp.]|nr:hypothetical protein [Solobacterium sp.]